MVNIEDLIARVKALSGVDREVDAEIALAFGEAPEGAFILKGSPDPGILGTGAYTFYRSPEFTGSIDAALAFADRVLPGCEVRIEKHPYGPCHAEIWERGNRYGIWSPTLPLAIILATLKAKVAE